MANAASQRSIANLLKRRNAPIIPKDQQKILDQPGSWAAELSDGFQLRVPKHVLQTTADAARASRKQASIEADLLLPSGRQPKPLLETNDISKNIPDSSLKSSLCSPAAERFVSWSPSPARSLADRQHQSPLPSSIRDVESCHNESPLPSRAREPNFSSPPPPGSQPEFSDRQSSPPPSRRGRANFLQQHLTEIWEGSDWLPPHHRDRPYRTSSIRILAALCRVTEIAKMKGIPLRSLWLNGGHLHPLSKNWPEVEEQCLQIVRNMEAKYGLPAKETLGGNSQDDTDGGYDQENFAPEIAKPSIASRYIAMDFDFPSSGPEDALETQLPQARIISQTPINQAATTPQLSNKSSSSAPFPATLNTPPCAQPSQHTIPATVQRQPSPPPEGLGEPEKKRRRMKPIQFSDPTAPEDVVVEESSRNSTSFARMASTKTYTQISSSNSISSSIIVPATIPQSPPVQRNLSRGRIQRTPEPNGTHSETGGSSQHHYDQPNERADDMGITVPPTIVELTPFELFTRTYPSYESQHRGSIWSFVRACLCLDYLMKSNSLREYLWDDFIRAFSADYLEYVENAKNPLPALDWFNTLTGAPVFTQLLVKRDTIHDILDSYPDEVGKAKVYTQEGNKNKSSGSESRESEDEIDSSAERPRATPQQNSPPRHSLEDPEIVVETVPSTANEGQENQTQTWQNPPKSQLPGPTSTPKVDREPKKHDTPQAEPTIPSTSTFEYATQAHIPRRLGEIQNPPFPSSARSTATRSSIGTHRGSSYLQRLGSSPKDSDAKRRERLRQHFLKKKTASTPSSRKAAGSG